MRIPLQIVVVLSGLLLAREFMPQSNEHFRDDAAQPSHGIDQSRANASPPRDRRRARAVAVRITDGSIEPHPQLRR